MSARTHRNEETEVNSQKFREAEEESRAIIAGAILFLLFLIYLLLVALHMDRGMIGGTCCSTPDVQLSYLGEMSDGVWEVHVSGVSEAKDMSYWNATLMKNGTIVEVLDPLTGTATDMTFTDIDGGERVTLGDYFRVRCEALSAYELSLIWKDSGEVGGSVEWTTEGYVTPPVEEPEEPVFVQTWFWVAVVTTAVVLVTSLILERRGGKRLKEEAPPEPPHQEES
ncbi:MAG: hypothetical protein ACE5IJ_00790 [Thermoplasmata archaeon]